MLFYCNYTAYGSLSPNDFLRYFHMFQYYSDGNIYFSRFIFYILCGSSIDSLGQVQWLLSNNLKILAKFPFVGNIMD